MYTPKSSGRKNDSMIRHTEFIEFIAEECKDARQPYNIVQLIHCWKQKSKSNCSVESYSQVIKNYRQRIPTLEQLDTKTKVTLMFALRADFDQHYLRELREHAQVEVNKYGKLVRYEANDGSFELGGERAKRMTLEDIRKRNSGRNQEEEQQSTSARRSGRLQKRERLASPSPPPPQSSATSMRKRGRPPKLTKTEPRIQNPASQAPRIRGFTPDPAPWDPVPNLSRTAGNPKGPVDAMPIAVDYGVGDPVDFEAGDPGNPEDLAPNSINSGHDDPVDLALDVMAPTPNFASFLPKIDMENTETPTIRRPWKLEEHQGAYDMKPVTQNIQRTGLSTVKMETDRVAEDGWKEIISLEKHKKFLESLQDLILTLELPIPRKLRRKIDNTIQGIKVYGTREENITTGEIHTASTSCLLIISKSAKSSASSMGSSSIEMSSEENSVSLRDFLLFLKNAVISIKSPYFDMFLETLKRSIQESQDKKIPLDKVQSALETIINIAAP